jgi:hypothetical protein
MVRSDTDGAKKQRERRPTSSAGPLNGPFVRSACVKQWNGVHQLGGPLNGPFAR